MSPKFLPHKERSHSQADNLNHFSEPLKRSQSKWNCYMTISRLPSRSSTVRQAQFACNLILQSECNESPASIECPMSALTGKMRPQFLSCEEGSPRVSEDRSSWSNIGKKLATGGSGGERDEKVGMEIFKTTSILRGLVNIIEGNLFHAK
jgi:hypothetical protein